MESSTPLISVIVPIYNTSKLLRRCIDSLLTQDYDNYEVILVNDGSTDDSLDICLEYSDHHIRILNKPNGGLASARNYGLNLMDAQSDYCTFVDSDDWVEAHHLSSLFSITSTTCLGICNITTERDGIQEEKTAVGSNRHYGQLKDNNDFLSLLKTGIMNSACNKLYNSHTVRYIYFKNIPCAEDITFNLEYLQRCEGVRFTDATTYHYDRRYGTLTSKVTREMYESYIDIHRRLIDWVNPKCVNHVHNFAYPQYLAIIMRFLHRGQYDVPQEMIRQPLVRTAFKAHKCTSLGEYAIHTCVKYGWLRAAAKI